MCMCFCFVFVHRGEFFEIEIKRKGLGCSRLQRFSYGDRREEEIQVRLLPIIVVVARVVVIVRINANFVN